MSRASIPPRERDVIRAVIKALEEQNADGMDAYAMSCVTDKSYRACSREQKAVLCLKALIS